MTTSMIIERADCTSSARAMETTMNIQYLSNKPCEDILGAAVDDARKFFERECHTLWDVCDCISHDKSRDAVEELIEIFSHHDPAPETIIANLHEIVCALSNVPFSVVDVLEQETRLNGAAGNAIRFYGPRLTDLKARILRATKGAAGSNRPN